MKIYLVAYLATGLAFLVLDGLWLSQMGPMVYRPIIGDAALDGFRIVPAAIFYALFLIGIVIFAVNPALVSGSWTTALVYGALFGFFAYATYDLTNQATLKNWSTTLSLIDMSWGTFLTAVSATVGYLAAAKFAG